MGAGMGLISPPEGLLTFMGHASTVIELDGVSLVTDPVLRPRVAHLRRQVPAVATKPRSPDAVLISHPHFDHLDLPSLTGFGRDVPIIAPTGTLKLLSRKGFTRVEELKVGQSLAIGPVMVTAVPAEHDGRRWPFGRGRDAIGYLIEGSRSVYFAGDTDIYDEMAIHLPEVDLALMPVWGWGHTLGPGHMDPERAARATALFRPRLAVPIHWGTLFPVGLSRWRRHLLEAPPRDFAKKVADYSPATEVRVLSPGGSTGIGPTS
jgi:L-ascorbate metabolism protein UlaG (beta-lactamase superfamily)